MTYFLHQIISCVIIFSYNANLFAIKYKLDQLLGYRNRRKYNLTKMIITLIMWLETNHAMSMTCCLATDVPPTTNCTDITKA